MKPEEDDFPVLKRSQEERDRESVEEAYKRLAWAAAECCKAWEKETQNEEELKRISESVTSLEEELSNGSSS